MNYELMNNNKVFLSGKVESEPEFSHETFGEGFYEVKLAVPRLSEHMDIIPVTVSEKLLAKDAFKVGNFVAIKGQFRSYNKIVNEKSRLMLTVFVRELIEVDNTMNPNIIEIEGFICKPPVYRTTPFKREICDVLVAVNRAYNKSDYIPTIAWGRNSRFCQTLEVGDNIRVWGRLQSREYQKKLNDTEVIKKIAYEVSISKMERVTEETEEIENNVTSSSEEGAI